MLASATRATGRRAGTRSARTARSSSAVSGRPTLGTSAGGVDGAGDTSGWPLGEGSVPVTTGAALPARSSARPRLTTMARIVIPLLSSRQGLTTSSLHIETLRSPGGFRPNGHDGAFLLDRRARRSHRRTPGEHHLWSCVVFPPPQAARRPGRDVTRRQPGHGWHRPRVSGDTLTGPWGALGLPDRGPSASPFGCPAAGGVHAQVPDHRELHRPGRQGGHG